jgi:hypothetical protein
VNRVHGLFYSETNPVLFCHHKESVMQGKESDHLYACCVTNTPTTHTDEKCMTRSKTCTECRSSELPSASTRPHSQLSTHSIHTYSIHANQFTHNDHSTPRTGPFVHACITHNREHPHKNEKTRETKHVKRKSGRVWGRKCVSRMEGSGSSGREKGTGDTTDKGSGRGVDERVYGRYH